MKKYLLIVLLVGVVSAQGPYIVETITEEEGLRDGPQSINPITYYPADADYLKASVILIPEVPFPFASTAFWLLNNC